MACCSNDLDKVVKSFIESRDDHEKLQLLKETSIN